MKDLINDLPFVLVVILPISVFNVALIALGYYLLLPKQGYFGG